MGRVMSFSLGNCGPSMPGLPMSDAPWPGSIQMSIVAKAQGAAHRAIKAISTAPRRSDRLSRAGWDAVIGNSFRGRLRWHRQLHDLHGVGAGTVLIAEVA